LVNKIKLRVAEAQRRDVGRFIVRVDNADMERLKIRVGDIVEVHGGKITASSKKNKGTTFTIQLPLISKRKKLHA